MTLQGKRLEDIISGVLRGVQDPDEGDVLSEVSTLAPSEEDEGEDEGEVEAKYPQEEEIDPNLRIPVILKNISSENIRNYKVRLWIKIENALDEFIAKNNTPIYQEFRYPQLKEKMKHIDEIKEYFENERDERGVGSLSKDERSVKRLFDRLWGQIFSIYAAWIYNYEHNLNIYIKNPDREMEEFNEGEIIDDIIENTKLAGEALTKNLVRYKSNIATNIDKLKPLLDKKMFDEILRNFGTILPIWGSGKKISLRKKENIKQSNTKLLSLKQTIHQILKS